MAETSTALERRASFAADFIGGTTNLAQRRRYQEDIQAARNERSDMADRRYGMAYDRAALADPMKAQQLQLEQRKFDQGVNEFDRQESRLLKAQTIDEEALKLREQLAKDAYTKTWMEIQDANKIREHTMALRKAEFQLRERGIKPRTPEYGNAIMPLLEQYDHADEKIVNGIWQATRVEEDLADVMAKKRALADQGIETKLRWTEGQDGRQSIGLGEITPAAPPDPLKKKRELERDLETANKRLLTSGSSPQMQRYWSSRIKETESQLLGLDQPVGQPAAQQPAASPAGGSQFTVGKSYRDKNGKVATFLGDGKWQAQ